MTLFPYTTLFRSGIVLRHVEVGADEDPLATGLALGAKVGEAEDVHGVRVREGPGNLWGSP
jgi:hypothetical protein